MALEEVQKAVGDSALFAAQQQPPPPPPPPPSQPYPYAQRLPPERKKRGCGWWILGIVAIGVFVVILLTLMAWLGVVSGVGGGAAGSRVSQDFVEETVEGVGNQKLLIIQIVGIIGAVPSPFGGANDSVAQVEEMLKIAESDPSVRGILLYVDSPGGGITASDIIHNDLMEFRKRTGVPIVALLGDVAASGGYYVASSADYIVAHPTTVTGSIGVIMPLFGIEGLLQKIGVEPRTIKSGEMKDMTSMAAPLSEEKRRILQNIVDEYQNRFVDVVLDGMTRRGQRITREKLLTHTDGRIFTGEQAKEIGFVDQIGYFQNALTLARKISKLPPNCKVVTYSKKPGLMDLLFAKANAANPGTVTLKIDGMPKLESESRFMYLWMPGESFEISSSGTGVDK